jgi:hypothetical protein
MPSIHIGGGNFDVGTQWLANVRANQQMALQAQQAEDERQVRMAQLAMAKRQQQMAQENADRSFWWEQQKFGSGQAQHDREWQGEMDYKNRALDQGDRQFSARSQQESDQFGQNIGLRRDELAQNREEKGLDRSQSWAQFLANKEMQEKSMAQQLGMQQAQLAQSADQFGQTMNFNKMNHNDQQTMAYRNYLIGKGQLDRQAERDDKQDSRLKLQDEGQAVTRTMGVFTDQYRAAQQAAHTANQALATNANDPAARAMLQQAQATMNAAQSNINNIVKGNPQHFYMPQSESGIEGLSQKVVPGGLGALKSAGSMRAAMKSERKDMSDQFHNYMQNEIGDMPWYKRLTYGGPINARVWGDIEGTAEKAKQNMYSDLIAQGLDHKQALGVVQQSVEGGFLSASPGAMWGNE